jgi:DNA mismatch repair protein MutS2
LLDDAIVVPLDIAMGRRASVLITGPNTGGKTVAIKCVGLFVAMAQSGLFLPAMDVRFAPFRQIWADIGDEQSLEQSLSTFSGHIKNIAEALRGMREGALVLMDEIGAGTDPAEGAALAISILREMVKRGAAILASTHYGELKAFAFETEGFENAAMEFDQKTLRPTYRLSLGAAGASQALRIAERYGIPKDTVEEARLSLGSQARDIAAMLERLETSQKQARIAQSEADRRAEELKKAEARASRKLKEADEIRSSAHEKAHEIIEAALREIRLEASRLFDELKKTPHETKVQDRVRAGLRELDNVGRDFANEFVPKAGRGGPSAPVGLAKGMSVTVQGYAQIGTLVEDPRDGKAIVQLGSLKMTLPTSVLTISEKAIDARPRRSVQLQKAMTAAGINPAAQSPFKMAVFVSVGKEQPRRSLGVMVLLLRSMKVPGENGQREVAVWGQQRTSSCSDAEAAAQLQGLLEELSNELARAGGLRANGAGATPPATPPTPPSTPNATP